MNGGSPPTSQKRTRALAVHRAGSVWKGLALAARYETLFGRPPRSRNRLHLLRRVAWKLQAERFGGLSVTAQKQLDTLMAQIEIPGAPPAATSAPTLVRAWHGKRIVARPVDGGFEFEGSVYGSLSAVAKAATGAHWNGRLFFRVNGATQ